jgi:hypothetical protein
MIPLKRPLLLLLAILSVSISAASAEEMPATVLAKPGKLLLEEDFAHPLPLPEGSTAQFASGFRGWRRNVATRGGRWEVEEGAFHGVENAEVHHPATASIGFDFKDVVIQCEVRLLDVPLAGRPRRMFMVRTTDAKDYVCSVIFDESGWRIQKDDNDHGGPDKPAPLGQVKTPIKLGEWQKVVFEILGEEMTVTVNGQSLAGRHPLIASGKKSIMFVAGVEGSVRGLKVWEAVRKD